MKRRVIFTIILLVTCLCSAFSLEFSYLVNYATNIPPEIYFTNNIDEASENDKLKEYFIEPGDSTKRGFYMHVIAKGSDVADITVYFSQFVPERGTADNSLAIPFEISFNNAQNYFKPEITPNISDAWTEDNSTAYTVTFTLLPGVQTSELIRHYIYRIEYKLTKDVSDFPAQTYTSTIKVVTDSSK